MKHHSVCALGIIVTSLLAACSSAKNDAADGGPGGGGGNDGGVDGAVGTDGGVDGSSGNDAGTDGTAPGNDGGVGLTSCANATLYAGNPYFTGTLGGWNPAGQDKLADPPLRNETLAVSGQTVYVDTNFEIWRTQGTQVLRVAGDENEPDSQYNPTGTCAAARFLSIKGVAVLPNGNVIVNDVRGNGLVELQSPTGTCMAAPYAGNQAKTLDTDITGEVASPGDVDGPGATAKFDGIGLPTVDAQGNVYIVDAGNTKIKKIANDAAHTVSTLFKYGSVDQPLPLSMTALNGKLYVAVGTVTNDILWEIDTQSGTQKVLYSGRGIYPNIDPSAEAVINAMTNDGTSLIVGSNKGYLYKVGLDGTVKATLAGMGPFADFPTGLDLKNPIASASLPLTSIGINNGSIVKVGNDILWAGVAGGVGFYVWGIHCQ